MASNDWATAGVRLAEQRLARAKALLEAPLDSPEFRYHLVTIVARAALQAEQRSDHDEVMLLRGVARRLSDAPEVSRPGNV